MKDFNLIFAISIILTVTSACSDDSDTVVQKSGFNMDLTSIVSYCEICPETNFRGQIDSLQLNIGSKKLIGLRIDSSENISSVKVQLTTQNNILNNEVLFSEFRTANPVDYGDSRFFRYPIEADMLTIGNNRLIVQTFNILDAIIDSDTLDILLSDPPIGFSSFQVTKDQLESGDCEIIAFESFDWTTEPKCYSQEEFLNTRCHTISITDIIMESAFLNLIDNCYDNSEGVKLLKLLSGEQSFNEINSNSQYLQFIANMEANSVSYPFEININTSTIFYLRMDRYVSEGTASYNEEISGLLAISFDLSNGVEIGFKTRGVMR